jgi:hypothetical protein
LTDLPLLIECHVHQARRVAADPVHKVMALLKAMENGCL